MHLLFSTFTASSTIFLIFLSIFIITWICQTWCQVLVEVCKFLIIFIFIILSTFVCIMYFCCIYRKKIFNISDQMRKEVKSSLLDCFKMDETTLNGVSYISIIDMGFISRLATLLPQPFMGLLKAILHGVIMQQRYSTLLFSIIPVP